MLEFLVSLAMLACIVLVGTVLSAGRCEAQWGEAGQWGLLSGCMVNTPEGWIPAENYRLVD